MSESNLRKEERERIKAHVDKHPASLAVIKTNLSPPGLTPIFRDLGRKCGMTLRRTLSSPLSDFGIAELDSSDKILIILYIGGERTELISVSETDEAVIKDLEESILSSNFHSELVRLGL